MKTFKLLSALLLLSLQSLGQILYTATDTVQLDQPTVNMKLAPYRGAIQWQYSKDGESWTDLSGETNPSLSMQSTGRFGYYRAKIQDAYCVPAYSDAALISSISVSVQTVSAGEITTVSAQLNGSISVAAGYKGILSRGFYLSTANASPTDSDIVYTSGSGAGSYSSLISGLLPATTYYFRAFGYSTGNTYMGEVQSFTTASLPRSVVSAETMVSYGVTANSATISGYAKVMSGTATITSAGFYWSSSNATPTSADNIQTVGLGGVYSYTLTGLAPLTTYYYVAYAITAEGTVVGSVQSFTTGSAIAIFAATGAAESITETSAMLNGEITEANGTATVAARGLYLSSTSTSPSAANTVLVAPAAGVGSYSISATGLTAGVTYYYRAYALMGSQIVLGSVQSFSTVGATEVLSVTTGATSAIAYTTATLNGKLTVQSGTATITATGFYYSATNINPSSADMTVATGSSAGDFTANISGLAAGTVYYVRAFAQSINGIILGATVSFTTDKITPVITATTAAASAITQTAATLNGSSDVAQGTAVITARGFYYSATSQIPTSFDQTANVGSGEGDYSASISGLLPNTTYYARAFATSSEGTVLGNVISFTTEQLIPVEISVNISAASNIAQTVATLSGSATITSGTTAITATGFCYSATNALPAIASDKSVIAGSSEGAFSSVISNLTAETTYYARAFATSAEGTVYSGAVTFTTAKIVPVVSVLTHAAANIKAKSASLSANASITAGTTSITATGFYWSSANAQPTSADMTVAAGTSAGDFTAALTQLTPNTIYYVRAFAVSSEGTILGNSVTFTTPAASEISATTKKASNILATSAVVAGSASVVSGTLAVTETGFVWSADITVPTFADNAIKAGTEAGAFETTIDNLVTGTKYYYRAYAVSPLDTVFGSVLAFVPEKPRDTVTITLQQTTAIANSNTVTISGQNVDITQGGTYLISGTLTDGQIHVASNDTLDVKIILSGVTIANSTSAAIYVENANNAKIELAAGTVNTLSDASTYVYALGVTEPSAALFSNDDIVITGTGTLNVTGNYKDGIASDDEVKIKSGTVNVTAADDAIVAQDAVEIKGGTITLTAAGDGIKTTNELDPAKGYILIEDGTVTVTAAGDGLVAATYVSITGGTVDLTTGGGSTVAVGTVSTKGIKAATAVNISGGTVTVNSSDDAINSNGTVTFAGGTTSLTTSAKGVNADGNVAVSSGAVTIISGNDGINTPAAMAVSGGTLSITAGDDGVKAAAISITAGTVGVSVKADGAKGLTSTGTMNITGGDITVNTAGGVILTASGTGFDPSYSTAIKSVGAMTIGCANITITATGIAGKGISSDGDITISCGVIKVTCSGAGAKYTNSLGTADAYAATCITADGSILITGGSITLTNSGTGGRGMVCNGTLTVDETTSQPVLTVTTTGGAVTITAGTGGGRPGQTSSGDTYAAKAVKCDGAATINGGIITINSADDGIKSETSITFNGGRTTVAKSYEGLESILITMNGGYANITASNDGVNTSEGTVSGGTESVDKSYFRMNGGTMVVTGMDAVDSNGNIEMNGGTLIVHGMNSQMEEGADFNGTFNMNGGYAIISGYNSSMTKAMSATSKQNNLYMTSSALISATTLLHLQDASGKDLLSFKPQQGGYKFLFSCPELKTGSSFSVFTGGSYNGGTSEGGLYTGGTYSAGTAKKTFTISSVVSTFSF